MSTHYLAQCNIGRMRDALDSPIMAGFAAQLQHINSQADSAPGFVWRLQTPAGDATGFRVFGDPQIILNLSVWQSVETLYEFTYRSEHTGVLRNRAEWFERMADYPTVALWWTPADQMPTEHDVKIRLDYLHAHGPSEFAFTFKQRFPTPD